MTFFYEKRLIFLNKIKVNIQEKKMFNRKVKNFLKFKSTYLFINMPKTIKNIMKFFNLFIKPYL